MKALYQPMRSSVLYQLFKRLLTLAIPLSLSRLLYMISSFIAVLMLGKLGRLQLAAGVLGVSTFSVVLVFTSSIFQALSILIRRIPKTQQPPLPQIMSLFLNSIFLSLGIAILAACFLWHADKLLMLTGQDPTLIAISKWYFQLSALAIIPSLLVSVVNQLIVGVGTARPLLYIELLIFGPRALLYYVFINGCWGMPALGLAGIAMTEMLIKSSVFLILLLSFGLSNFAKPYRRFLTINYWQINYNLMRRILLIGLPIAIQSSGEITAMSVAGYLMGRLGVTALAALSVTNQYTIPIMMFAYGLSQALTLLISEVKDDANSQITSIVCIQAALVILVIFAIPFIILFINCSSTLLNLFVPANAQDSYLQSLTASFFIISAFFIVIEGIRNIIIGALWAVSNSYISIMISLSIIWCIGLPLCYLFAFIFNGGPIGLRLGFLSGLIISMMWLGLNLLSQLPKSKSIASLNKQI